MTFNCDLMMRGRTERKREGRERERNKRKRQKERKGKEKETEKRKSKRKRTYDSKKIYVGIDKLLKVAVFLFWVDSPSRKKNFREGERQ